ncbi:MAG: hypothetical protein ACLFUR_05120 [Candidatus Hadarchaeia archaeon]
MSEKGLIKIIAAVALILIVVIAGAYLLLTSPGEMEIGNLTLSRDADDDHNPIDETSEFEQSEVVHITGEINNPKADSELYVRVLDEEGNTVCTFEDDPLEWEEDESTTYSFHFPCMHDDGEWEAGEYRLEVFLDSETIESLEFEVISTGPEYIEPSDLNSIEADYGDNDENLTGRLQFKNLQDEQELKMRQELYIEQDLSKIVLNLNQETMWFYYDVPPSEGLDPGWVIAKDEDYDMIKEQITQMRSDLLESIPENWTGESFIIEGQEETQLSNIEVNPELEDKLFEIEDYQDPSEIETKIENATLSENIDENHNPIGITEQFGIEETVFVTADVHDPAEGNEVYTEWYDEDGNTVYSFEEDPITWEENKTGIMYNIHFNLGPPEVEWSPGNYRVDIVLEGSTVESLEFEVIDE